MPSRPNLIGKKFGKLTVIKMSQVRNGRPWLCRCDCGKIKEKALTHYELKAGKRNSCGCDHDPGRGMRKHGQHNTKLYRVWSSMKHRCSQRNSPHYHNYGGRGIEVCSEWMGFESFHEWAMANGYREGLTIERIDNDGNYEPDNCAWIPKGDQSNNTRRCRFFTYNGKTHNMKEWSVILNIPYHRIQGRIRRGLSFEEAIK